MAKYNKGWCRRCGFLLGLAPVVTIEVIGGTGEIHQECLKQTDRVVSETMKQTEGNEDGKEANNGKAGAKTVTFGVWTVLP